VVDVHVIVYSQRPQYTAEPDAGEVLCTASGAPGSRTLTVTMPAAGRRPSLRKGTWLLDVTRETGGDGLKKWGPVHAHFYKAVSVTATGNTMVVELETPLLANVSQVAVMEYVVGVFDKGPAWRAPAPYQGNWPEGI
jgi:hypothetical protein